MLHYRSILLHISILVVIFSCKEAKESNEIRVDPISDVEISHAVGFQITNFGDYKVLKISDPWPKAEKSYSYALIPKENAARITLDRDAYDAIILTPIERAVVTSTTHIPALELLNVEQSIVGFPETDSCFWFPYWQQNYRTLTDHKSSFHGDLVVLG